MVMQGITTVTVNEGRNDMNKNTCKTFLVCKLIVVMSFMVSMMMTRCWGPRDKQDIMKYDSIEKPAWGLTINNLWRLGASGHIVWLTAALIHINSSNKTNRIYVLISTLFALGLWSILFYDGLYFLSCLLILLSILFWIILIFRSNTSFLMNFINTLFLLLIVYYSSLNIIILTLNKIEIVAVPF